MRDFIKEWWWLVLVLTAGILYVGWKETRCQAQAYQCRAYYAAQSASAGPLGVNKSASEQEAINAACEPNSYLCRLFSSANLPTLLLVIIGIGGVYAALRTIKVLEAQTSATERSVTLQEVAWRQWLELSDWDAPPELREDHGDEVIMPMLFSVANPTTVPLELIFVNVEVDNSLVISVGFPSISLPPARTQKQIVKFKASLKGIKLARYKNGHHLMGIRVTVRFKDAFERIQNQIFEVNSVAAYGRRNTFEPYAYTPEGQQNQENTN